MPVELRKRKAPAAPAPPPPAKKRSNAVKNAANKVKAAVTGKANGTGPAPEAGSSITLEDFGGEIETHDGTKTTLAKLVADSKGGVILFTYPKASTPGCTKQACLFRDAYTPLTSTGYDIYGLSRDSPKANTTFKEKQSLPYPLLCDPKATLISAIGMKKAPSGTTRGIFVIDKSGKVLAAEPGGPDHTYLVVRKLIGGGDIAMSDAPPPSAPDSEITKVTASMPAAPASTPEPAPAVPAAISEAPAPAPAPAPEHKPAGPASEPLPVPASAPVTEAEPAEPAPTPVSASAPEPMSIEFNAVIAPAPVSAAAPVVETKPIEPAPTKLMPEPAASTINKEPMPPTPAENAAKAATAESAKPTVPITADIVAQTLTSNGAPKEHNDAAIAKVAADVADTASKVDPATPNPA